MRAFLVFCFVIKSINSNNSNIKVKKVSETDSGRTTFKLSLKVMQIALIKLMELIMVHNS